MINDIIINNNLVVLKTDSKEELEIFIKIFTVLDKHKAARTLFKDEVSVEYTEEDTIDIIKLIKEVDFSYVEVESIIDHLRSHGIAVSSEALDCAFSQAYKKLKHQDIIFCSYQNYPQCNLRVNKDVISIRPVAKEHLDLSSANGQMLIELLQKEKSMYNCTIENNIIYVTGYIEVHRAVSSIVEILVKCSLLQKQDRKLIAEQLIQLAFRDFTVNELKIIRNITSYPNDHPLSKYKNIARAMEDIFVSLVDNNLSVNAINKLKNALNQEGEFSLAPKIITKSLSKLDKNFHGELNVLINPK